MYTTSQGFLIPFSVLFRLFLCSTLQFSKLESGDYLCMVRYDIERSNNLNYNFYAHIMCSTDAKYTL